MAQIEMDVDSLRHAMRNDEWVLLLKEKFGQRYLAICIGDEQAEAIGRTLEGKQLSESQDFRSLPHIVSLLPMVESASVVIGRLEGGIFFATLSLTYRSRTYEIELSAAPAVTLGMRATALIFAEESVLYKASVGIPA